MIQKMFLFKSHLIEHAVSGGNLGTQKTSSVVPSISVTKVQINFMVDYHHKMQLASVSDTKTPFKIKFILVRFRS